MCYCRNIVRFPKQISGLTSLVKLDIFQCQGLLALPAEVGTCTALKVLYIQRCQRLRSLPAEMESLVNLEYLVLYECDGLAWLPDLAHLDKLLKKNAVAVRGASATARARRDGGLRALEAERDACAQGGCAC